MCVCVCDQSRNIADGNTQCKVNRKLPIKPYEQAKKKKNLFDDDIRPKMVESFEKLNSFQFLTDVVETKKKRSL